MFKALSGGFHRWLAVDRYEKDEHIRCALEWILGRANYRALLKVFVEALSPASSVSEAERRALLDSLEKADRGEQVMADSLPRVADRQGRLTIGAWLTNARRRDLHLMPQTADEVVPISCYCDDDTGRVIASTFRALGYSGETSRLVQLRQVTEQARLRNWAEVTPFVVGPCFASCGSSLSFSDALLLPRTGSAFFYDPSLGAFHLPAFGTIIVRIAAARAIGRFLQRLAIGTPLPAIDAARQVRKTGWKVESLH
jgi:hypothetical protein